MNPVIYKKINLRKAATVRKSKNVYLQYVCKYKYELETITIRKTLGL